MPDLLIANNSDRKPPTLLAAQRGLVGQTVRTRDWIAIDSDFEKSNLTAGSRADFPRHDEGGIF